MKRRYFCGLTKFDEEREILVALILVFYFAAVIISIIYFGVTENLTIGTFFVSILILGNLGWIAYLVVIFPFAYLLSLTQKY